MLLYYIRHGDPIYSPDTLTPLGRREAEALARRLAAHGIDRLYSSTSERARLTAQPTAELLKKEITLLDWCNEKYAGEDFAIPNTSGGRTWVYQHPDTFPLLAGREVQALGDLWYTHPALADYHFERGMARVQGEADAFLESLGYRHDRAHMRYECMTPNEERVALFAHHGFACAFLSAIMDIPYPVFSTRFCMTHSAVTVIDFTARDGICIPRILTYSNDAHIYASHLSTRYNNGPWI